MADAYNDLTYLRCREAQAAEAGHAAANSAAKKLHFQMAEAYASRIETIKVSAEE